MHIFVKNVSGKCRQDLMGEEGATSFPFPISLYHHSPQKNFRNKGFITSIANAQIRGRRGNRYWKARILNIGFGFIILGRRTSVSSRAFRTATGMNLSPNLP